MAMIDEVDSGVVAMEVVTEAIRRDETTTAVGTTTDETIDLLVGTMIETGVLPAELSETVTMTEAIGLRLQTLVDQGKFNGPPDHWPIWLILSAVGNAPYPAPLSAMLHMN